jgi:hypothetical protein
MQNFKSHAISALVTIGTTFVTVAGTIIVAVPQETWQSPDVYTTSFWLSLLVAVVRGMARPLVATFVKNYYK